MLIADCINLTSDHPVGVALLLVSLDGVVLDANEPALRLYGYDAGELIGLHCAKLCDSSVQPCMFGDVEDSETLIVAVHRRSDGSPFYAEVRSTLVRPDAEAAVLCLVRDATETVDTLDSLADANRRLQSVIDACGFGTWEWNVQTGETVHNERWAKMLGYTLEELAPASYDTWIRLTHPADLDAATAMLERHFAGEIEQYESECRVRHSDGHWVWVQDWGRVISRTPEGEPLMMFGTHADITERKLVEQALAESEERFRILVEKTDVGISVGDPDGTILVYNDAMERLSGYTRQEVETHGWFELVFPAPEQKAEAIRLAQEALDGARPYVEISIVRKDGTSRWLAVSTTVIAMGGKDYNMSVFSDIHERVMTEIALRTSESQRARAQELVMIGHWMLDHQSGALTWSDEAYRLFGLGRGDSPLTYEEFLSCVHPGDRQFVDDAYAGSLADLTGYDIDHRIIRQDDGEIRYMHERCKHRRDEHGTLVVSYGAFQDITERKQAEEVLRESEAQLKKAQYFARIGNWTWNIKTNHLHWSDEMYRIFGIEQAGFNGSLPEVIATAIHPDDRAEVERSNLSVINEGKPIPLEYRIVWPDQSVHVVWAEAGELLLDDNGKPSLLRGTVQDITDRKTAERLGHYNARLRALTAELAVSEQRERNRLGVELHDGVGQLLLVAKISAQLLAAEPLETSAKKQAEKLVALLGESIREVRQLTSELAPTVLFELGLRSSLLWLRDRYSQLYGLRCTVRVDRHAAQLRGGAMMFVFRVAREALNNVVRHSHVDRAILTVRKSDGWMTVIIRDSGAGFDTALVDELGETGGFGLFSIREECLGMGGTMEIESQPGKGTRIKVCVPDEAVK